MAICRNIQNNVLYRYLGDNKYRNLCTGVEGIVAEGKAKEVFKINLNATELFGKYPQLEVLIQSLKLKADVGGMQE